MQPQVGAVAVDAIDPALSRESLVNYGCELLPHCPDLVLARPRGRTGPRNIW
jgi:hypothetical protein